jgi:maltose O-acetyltransferase
VTARVTLRGCVRNIAVNWVAASRLTPRTLRYLIYRAAGIQLGTRNIAAGCFIGGPDLSIGRKCFVNHDCFFDVSARIEIGDGCYLGMQTLICTSSHEIGDSARRAGRLYSEPVHIGRGVWIGARATILPGVRIGDGCVIGAGSTVLRDCKPDSLYAGTPARFVRELSGPDFTGGTDSDDPPATVDEPASS